MTGYGGDWDLEIGSSPEIFCAPNWAGTLQSPGGVNANLQRWYRGDAGVTTGATFTWTDQKSIANATQGTAGNQPSYTNFLNFNPVVTFDGTDDRLNLANATGLPAGTAGSTVYFVAKNGAIGTSRRVFSYGTNTDNRLFTIGQSGGNALVFGGGTNFANNANAFNAVNNIVLGRGGYNGTLAYSANTGTAGTNSATFTPTWTAANGAIGANRTAAATYSAYWQGDIAELIAFSANHNAATNNRIESYLALKYGLTLANTVTQYVASDGTTQVWNNSVPTYWNDIVGIGRDNASGATLNQEISRSVNTDDILTISTDNNFTGANGSHTDLATNLAYLVFGNNNGGTSETTASLPTGYSTRIARQWLVKNTNFTQSVFLSFTGFGSTATKKWYIIKRNGNANLSTGITQVVELNSNGETSTAITLNDGDYITLASCILPSGITVFALQATCTNNIPNSDAYLRLAEFSNADRINYSLGSTYSGDANYANATTIGTLPFVFANNLTNPSGTRNYTVRLFNGSSGCYTDVVVTLEEQTCNASCSCTDYLYVNDPAFDYIHKFVINSNGSIGAEIGSPWLPTGNITNAHGVVGDVNGNLYIAQIDVTPTQLFQVACDGTVLSNNVIPNWNRTLNLATIGNTIYSIGRSTTVGTPYNIYSHDICTGVLNGSIQVPNTGTPSWGLTKGLDGQLYFSSSFNAGSTFNHEIYRVEADLSSYTLVASLPKVAGYATLGISQDQYGNFYMVITNLTNSFTTVYKINSSGTLLSSISDNTLDQTGFAGSWGIVYNEQTGKLYIGTLGDDCVAVIDAGGATGAMTYQSTLGVPYVPGGYSKAINIVRECCPVSNRSVIDKTICGSSIGDEIILSDLLDCEGGLICEGTWSAASGNIGMTYDPCRQSVTFNASSGCGSFTLSSDGLGNNLQCGTFEIELNIEIENITAPVIAGTQTVCSGGDPAAFTTATPAAGSSTISYQWQSSTTSCSAGFNDISGATSATFDPPSGLTQTTFYRVIAEVGEGGCSSGVCLDTSNCVTVTVNPNPDFTLALITGCPGVAPEVAITGLTSGTPATTTMKINAGSFVPYVASPPNLTTAQGIVPNTTNTVTVRNEYGCETPKNIAVPNTVPLVCPPVRLTKVAVD